MNCISCQTPLKPLTTQTATIDYCPTCRSVWFDRDELKRFDDPADTLPQEVDVPAATPIVDYSQGARKCPVCADAFMCRRSFDVQETIEVDQCLQCSGIWLDGGELAAIREQYPSEEARAKAESKWLDEQLKATARKIKEDIGSETLQIMENRRTVQYRLFHAISDFLGLEPE